MKILPLIAMAIGLATTTAARAEHIDMESCFQDAGIRYVALTSGIDVDAAREISAILPEGQRMMSNMSDAAEAALEARNAGLTRDIVVVFLRGSMAETPVLAALVELCLETYY